MSIEAPVCNHGPMVFEEWATENRSWAAWLPAHGKGESWKDTHGQACKPIFISANGRSFLPHLDPRKTEPVAQYKPTATGRTYNPATGKYELPAPVDPWAGAPAGIRLKYQSFDGTDYLDVVNDGTYQRNRGRGWKVLSTTPDIQREVSAARRMRYEFPDFDDAPFEGVRCYVKFAWGFVPYVVRRDGTGDAASTSQVGDGRWLTGAALSLRDLRNWENSYSPLYLVDELPKPAAVFETDEAYISLPANSRRSEKILREVADRYGKASPGEKPAGTSPGYARGASLNTFDGIESIELDCGSLKADLDDVRGRKVEIRRVGDSLRIKVPA